MKDETALYIGNCCMRINVISPRSEFAHSISRKLRKYEIVWHDINKLPRNPENFHADHDRVIGYLMETDRFCQTDENLIKYLRMNAYDGFILVVSGSRQRYRASAYKDRV